MARVNPNRYLAAATRASRVTTVRAPKSIVSGRTTGTYRRIDPICRPVSNGSYRYCKPTTPRSRPTTASPGAASVRRTRTSPVRPSAARPSIGQETYQLNQTIVIGRRGRRVLNGRALEDARGARRQRRHGGRAHSCPKQARDEHDEEAVQPDHYRRRGRRASVRSASRFTSARRRSCACSSCQAWMPARTASSAALGT